MIFRSLVAGDFFGLCIGRQCSLPNACYGVMLILGYVQQVGNAVCILWSHAGRKGHTSQAGDVGYVETFLCYAVYLIQVMELCRP